MYSDHSIVECATKYHPSNVQEAKKQKKYSPAASQFEKLNFFSEDADWMRLNDELKDHNWSQEFQSDDPDSMLRCFIDVCSAAASEYIPERKAFSKTSIKSRIPRERTSWGEGDVSIPNCARPLQKLEDGNWRKKPRKLRRNYNVPIARAEKNSDDKAIGAIKRNSKYFFSYAK